MDFADTFHNVSLDLFISRGVHVKTMYKTQVIRMRQADEERVGEWQDALREFNLVPVLRDQEDLDYLLAFFRARLGPTFAFKIRDPIDYRVTLQYINNGDGVSTQFQLIKTYNSGLPGDTYSTIRPIIFPDSPVQLYLDGDLQSSGYSVDYLSGVVTFTSPPGNGVLIKWTGTFQVPVAFTTAQMFTSIAMYQDYDTPLTLLEQRAPVSSFIVPDAEPEDFVEVQFPPTYAERSRIGPQLNVITVSSASGATQRTPQFLESKIDFNVDQSIRTIDQMEVLLHFFHARRGRLIGFRAHDITDFSVTNEFFGTGDDNNFQFRLQKVYALDSYTQTRLITKPIEPISIYINGDIYPTASVDYTTGIVSFGIGILSLTFVTISRSIYRSTGTWADDGLIVGSKFYIQGSTLNDSLYTVASFSDTQTLETVEFIHDESSIDCKVDVPPPESSVLTWTGTYDVPTRFDTDTLDLSIDGYDVTSWNNISLSEFSVNYPTISITSGNNNSDVVLKETRPPGAYLQFLGTGTPGSTTPFLQYPRYDFAGFLQGSVHITMLFVTSHINNNGVIFDFQKAGLLPTLRVQNLPYPRLFWSNGLVKLDVDNTGSSGPTAWYCKYLAGQGVSVNNAFSEEFLNLEEIQINCVTVDFVNGIFMSGSSYTPYLQPGGGSIDVCNIPPGSYVLPENPILTSPHALYSFSEAYGAFVNNMSLGGIDDSPGSSYNNTVDLRLYEFLIFNSRGTLEDPDAIVKRVHTPLIKYFYNMYKTGKTEPVRLFGAGINRYGWWRGNGPFNIIDGWFPTQSSRIGTLYPGPGIGPTTVTQHFISELPPLNAKMFLAAAK